ncbi:TPA: hypothetical protein ACGUM0_003942 [Vibrio vulnificus]
MKITPLEVLEKLSAVYGAIQFSEKAQRHYVEVITNRGKYFIIENNDSVLVCSKKRNDYKKVELNNNTAVWLIKVFGEPMPERPVSKPTTPVLKVACDNA